MLRLHFPICISPTRQNFFAAGNKTKTVTTSSKRLLVTPACIFPLHFKSNSVASSFSSSSSSSHFYSCWSSIATLKSTARFCCSSSSSTTTLSVEEMDAASGGQEGNPHLLFSADEPDFSSMQPVAAADSFAKPRVVNYMKRFPVAPASFQCSKVSAGWFRCELRVPIFVSKPQQQQQQQQQQEPDRVAIASGFARTSERDAESVCAMHAERIIDASGAELFSLGTMQSRHALSAIKDGRWARFPRNHAQRAAQDAEMLAASKEQQQEEEQGERSLHPPPLVLAPDGFACFTASSSSSSSRRHDVGGGEDVIEITLNEMDSSSSSSSSSSPQQQQQGDDASEIQHEGIEIDQAEHADWRIFPRVAASPDKQRPVPGSKRHLDESEGGRYWLVEFGMMYHSEPHTMLSPHVFCPDSLARVAAFFERTPAFLRPGASSFSECVETSQLPLAAWAGQRVTLFKKSVRFPGERTVAVGVAREEERALHLCAMHCELLIDRLGFQLHPDPETQRLHADFCACVGRWAVSPSPSPSSPLSSSLSHESKFNNNDEDDAAASSSSTSTSPPARFNDEMPKPLREWGDTVNPARRSGRATLQARRLALLSEAEFHIHCHHCIVHVGRSYCVECNPDDLDVTLLEALRDFNIRHGAKRELFFLNYDYHSVWRATILLPLDMSKFGIRGGMAVGNTTLEAKLLAARHAVEILCTFGIPLYADRERQREFEEDRRRRGLFVVKRDEKTYEAIADQVPSQKTRSPASLRMSGAPRRLPSYEETRTAQMVAAEVFSVVDLFGDVFDRNLVLAFEHYLENCKNQRSNNTKTTTTRQVEDTHFHLKHVYSLQPVKGFFHVAANTLYAPIPLPVDFDFLHNASAVFALGRGETIRQAEKCFYLHALRIIDSVDLLHLCLPSPSSSPQASSNLSSVEGIRHSLYSVASPTVSDQRDERSDKKRNTNSNNDNTSSSSSSSTSSSSSSSSPSSSLYSWGMDAQSTCTPLRVLDQEGKAFSPSECAEMRFLPCPIMDAVIAARCAKANSKRKRDNNKKRK